MAVDPATYADIRDRLASAGIDLEHHARDGRKILDLRGTVLVAEKEPPTVTWPGRWMCLREFMLRKFANADPAPFTAVTLLRMRKPVSASVRS